MELGLILGIFAGARVGCLRHDVGFGSVLALQLRRQRLGFAHTARSSLKPVEARSAV